MIPAHACSLLLKHNLATLDAYYWQVCSQCALVTTTRKSSLPLGLVDLGLVNYTLACSQAIAGAQQRTWPMAMTSFCSSSILALIAAESSPADTSRSSFTLASTCRHYINRINSHHSHDFCAISLLRVRQKPTKHISLRHRNSHQSLLHAYP